MLVVGLFKGKITGNMKGGLMTALWLLRYQGIGWALFRARYWLWQRLGVLEQRSPRAAWSDLSLAANLWNPFLAEPGRYLAHRRQAAPPFFFSPADRSRYLACFTPWDEGCPTLAQGVQSLGQGRLRYFGGEEAVVGFPPDWLRDPFSGQRAAGARHWSRLDLMSGGDIKVIWEPSRFSFAYDLVRAYWRGGGQDLAEMFWSAVEDWLEHNPPNSGPNWACGQEAALRAMAWCFGLYGFMDCPATTGPRVARLALALAITGRRIEANLDYALWQRNNHGISEGVGLWTIGLLFPEFKQAARWRELGRRVLEDQARQLIYNDGGCSPQSANYHRLIVHDYLWAIRLGQLNRQPLSQIMLRRVARAGELLYWLQDESSGRVPMFGHCDGALVLPLNNCAFNDFRPVVQAAAFLAGGRRRLPTGPWDEDLLWLFGPQALEGEPGPVQRPASLAAPESGHYLLRGEQGMALVHCPTRRQHRPAQADMLHVDLWWQGRNIALDAGTYAYNGHEPWRDALARTGYHNTVSVDGRDQMERFSPFIWLPWRRGRVRSLKESEQGRLAWWQGSHDAYQRLAIPVAHHRAVLRLGGDAWLVLDRLVSQRPHHYRLHWLLIDADHDLEQSKGRLCLHLPEGDYHVLLGCGDASCLPGLVRAQPRPPRGWQAPTYRQRTPALSLALSLEAASSWFWSLFSPQPVRLQVEDRALRLEGLGWQARVGLADPSLDGWLVDSVEISGDIQDVLQAA